MTEQMRRQGVFKEKSTIPPRTTPQSIKGDVNKYTDIRDGRVIGCGDKHDTLTRGYATQPMGKYVDPEVLERQIPRANRDVRKNERNYQGKVMHIGV